MVVLGGGAVSYERGAPGKNSRSDFAQSRSRRRPGEREREEREGGADFFFFFITLKPRVE